MTTIANAVKLVELEERSAAIYMNFARRFQENKALSRFWLEMSMEERQHAVMLDFFGGDDRIEDRLPDSLTVSQVSDQLKDLEARAGRKNLSVDEAFLIAAELEASEINAIYDRIVRPAEGTWYLTRKKIETLGQSHLNKVVEAARQFGVSVATLEKLSIFTPPGQEGQPTARS